jgi:hypothetical protein
MKLSFIPLALITLVIFASTLGAQATFPRMTSVEPTTAKVGAEVSAAGENLDKANVTEVFLTDGQNDIKVQMTQQAATEIKFKIPDSVKPGRFSLMVLTATKPPRLIEQPVRLTVE